MSAANPASSFADQFRGLDPGAVSVGGSESDQVGDELSDLQQGDGPMLASVVSAARTMLICRGQVCLGDVGAGDLGSGPVPDRSDL